MAVRERAAAAMAALERRVPSLDDFAGQSWSSWVERADLPATDGAELEESSKNTKKLDAMTLIKEDMSIFGHCPAHDDFYLVVCNHCSQVVKPQAFQKHCERRHGPLSKLYTRAPPPPPAPASSQKCHVVNGQGPACRAPGSTKTSSREKGQGSRSRGHQPPEKTQKDNLCLFVPVVNLEKMSSLPKPDGHGIRVAPPSAFLSQPGGLTKDSPGKPPMAPPSKEPPGRENIEIIPSEGSSHRAEGSPPEKEPSGARLPPKTHRKMARKECDLNRQCGVINPETKKICTRLLTCKIHSVHQRREVQGRAKDFDVLVAELKANSRKGESPKEKSPGRKEQVLERPSQELPSAVQVVAAVAAPSSTFSVRAKQTYPYCALPRSRASSESELDDEGPCGGDGDPGLFPFPMPRGGAQASSEESEEEGTSDDLHLPPDCHYATRPPRPQAFCTFGSRLVSPGCYVFSRRLDRFCSALSSMLERHLSSHMWKKIPPVTEPPSHLVNSPLSAPLSPSSTGSCPRLPGPPPRPACPASTPPTKDSLVPSYPAGSPSVAAACSQAECMGGSQAITSPLPANTPSPSFSKLPPSKASKSSKGKDGVEMEAPSRKRKLSPGPTTFKRTCILEPTGKGKPSGCRGLSAKTKTALSMGLNGTMGPRVKRAGPLDCRGSPHQLPTPVKASQLENRGAAGHPGKALSTNCLSEEEVAKKRKNLATYCRPVKAKHCQAGAPADVACSVRRKKPGPALAFEEKCSTLKVLELPLFPEGKGV
ncbi:ataxin-7-like protein 2 isoform X1 [Sapajus apella]|uniref:Ataxin-7-like protein 2 isoform X1 n=2 Tax=Sapajus apella TaxID=9515 RepID=A0A6J3FJZ4_SAPAP|nr:ataxin-7-like protein 2 isoform X1 [Sapajus apella]XP_032105739.1 ataxin-7-like protein 2 isoform X1 [Sapajus apella]XP_032105740.1 ataxin-7-like protein 2 isoform X1 [Sapajus apella]